MVQCNADGRQAAEALNRAGYRIAARLERDAVVAGIERAALDQDVAAGFRMAAVIIAIVGRAEGPPRTEYYWRALIHRSRNSSPHVPLAAIRDPRHSFSAAAAGGPLNAFLTTS
jgi:hypothetical protein